MDKKGTKILVGCILCTMIVLMLFIIVIKFTQLSCELVALEPVALRSLQLNNFQRDKPIRSNDKTILMKISAFLEYNVQESTASGSSGPPEPGKSLNNLIGAPSPPSSSSSSSSSIMGVNNGPIDNPFKPPTINNNNVNNQKVNLINNVNMTPNVSLASGPANNQILSGGANLANKSLNSGPQPSVPANNFNPALNSSFLTTTTKTTTMTTTNTKSQILTNNNGPNHQHPRAEKRFLPLELKSIETRNLGNHKHKYILSFNCTKLNMILVHENNTVYVEKMDMELKPVGIRQKATCEMTLDGGRAFMVPAIAAQGPLSPPPPPPPAANQNVATNVTGGGAPAHQAPAATINLPNAQLDHTQASKDDGRNMARYFCDKPLRFECHYWSKKSGPAATNGFLLADLQINAIEFETSRSPSSKGDHKHVKTK